MKWTLKHYYPFSRGSGLQGGSLLSAHAWDQVRLGATECHDLQAFGLPQERAEWVRLCRETESAAAIARSLAALVRQRNYWKVVSVGVGRACVEFHLKLLLPAVELTCTEYGPGVVARLRAVFTECDQIEHMDIQEADWGRTAQGTLVLLNRLDTELDDRQWMTVFEKLHAGGVPEVLLVATGILTLKVLGWEAAQRIRSLIRGQQLTFAGYTRTEARLRELWSSSYDLIEQSSFGGLRGYLLKRKTR
jgi:hypothetical protein